MVADVRPAKIAHADCAVGAQGCIGYVSFYFRLESGGTTSQDVAVVERVRHPL